MSSAMRESRPGSRRGKPKPMFSAMLRWGKSAPSCATYPIATMCRNRLRPIGQDLSVKHHLPGIRRIESGDDAQERRLARAGRSHHGGAAVGAHAEIHAVERRNRPVAAADPLEFKQVHRLAAGFEYMYSNNVSGRENNTIMRA